jgi:methyl-accepting chemotaxis protein
MINDVSNRLFGTNERINEYSATLANHSAQIKELYNNSQAVAQVIDTIDNINASIGLIKYNDTQRDASISALREYQRNTVDSLLSSYSQRLTNAESLAVDCNGIANDVSNRLTSALSDNITDINKIANTLNSSVNAAMTNNIATINQITNTLNSSVNSALSTQTNFVNQSIDGVNSSINVLIANVNERDFVTASALNLHDASINYILCILRNKGLID